MRLRRSWVAGFVVLAAAAAALALFASRGPGEGWTRAADGHAVLYARRGDPASAMSRINRVQVGRRAFEFTWALPRWERFVGGLRGVTLEDRGYGFVVDDSDAEWRRHVLHRSGAWPAGAAVDAAVVGAWKVEPVPDASRSRWTFRADGTCTTLAELEWRVAGDALILATTSPDGAVHFKAGSVLDASRRRFESAAGRVGTKLSDD